MPLTFYYGSGSPFSWKVWLALEHKRIPYDFRRLSFDAGDLRKPEYLAINPRHKVPAIVDDGLVLYESSAIIEYLEERYASYGEPLWPRETNARALARRLAAEADLYVQPAVGKLVRETIFRRTEEPDPTALAEAKQGIAQELALVERSIAGDFLAGSELSSAGVSAADFALYPALALLGRIDDKRPGYEARSLIPPRLRAWMVRMEALPYLERTRPPHWKE